MYTYNDGLTYIIHRKLSVNAYIKHTETLQKHTFTYIYSQKTSSAMTESNIPRFARLKGYLIPTRRAYAPRE